MCNITRHSDTYVCIHVIINYNIWLGKINLFDKQEMTLTRMDFDLNKDERRFTLSLALWWVLFNK